MQRKNFIATVRLLAISGGAVLCLSLTSCKKAPAPAPSPAPVTIPAPSATPVAPPAPVVTVPMVNKHLYPPVEDAKSDLAKAIATAHRQHKRVLVDFGGDWCGDCQVLDIYANEAPNAELIDKYFVKVNINIGHIDTNKDIAARCGVELRGVPALAVLDGNGKIIFAQHNEFSNMRAMKSSDLTDFLNKWKK